MVGRVKEDDIVGGEVRGKKRGWGTEVKSANR